MKKQGQMLVEVVVAVGILVLVLIGISDLMTRSSRLLSFQRDREEAYSIAKELLNTYRVDRDLNVDLFFATVGSLSRDICIVGKKYGCRVDKVDVTGGVILKATVYWNEGVNRYEISLDQLLTSI